jgi:multiple antibiotic resistance protein
MISLNQILEAFLVLFAIIDVFAAMPTVIKLKKQGKTVSASRAGIFSTIMLLVFFYVGDAMLKLFHIDLPSFAVAGSIVIFVIGLEMTLNIHIFRDNKTQGADATFIPVVFPLLTGAGVFTTVLSIRAQYADINMLIAMALNVLVIYLVIRLIDYIEKFLGDALIYMMQKFFGIILLSIALKLFVTNLTYLINQITM